MTCDPAAIAIAGPVPHPGPSRSRWYGGGVSCPRYAATAARETIARIQLTADNVAGLSHLHNTQYNIGATYALLGDTRQAVSWLKKASREGLPCYPLFERDPNLDGLRQDPEFVAFMQQLKSQAEQFRSTL